MVAVKIAAGTDYRRPRNPLADRIVVCRPTHKDCARRLGSVKSCAYRALRSGSKKLQVLTTKALISLTMIKEEPKRRRGERPKTPASEALNRERTELTRIRRQQSEMLLAKARGELITKELVLKQAAYLLVALRQRILSLPQTYSRRLLGITDQREMAARLKEMSLSILNEG
jgi:hypothetical protein